MTILGIQNGVSARKNGDVSAEIIIHLWVLGRVPVLSDLIHHSSSLGTKIAALTLENDTHSVLIMVLFWVTQVYKLKSDIINTYEHAHTLKHIYNLRYHCKMSLTP